jgi:tRNA A-37 threonylcarbamoyl transferase component Bud32
MPPFPVFRQYEIIRELGSGGMATVYEALDRKLNRSVALKIMHPHLYKDESAAERFQREAMAAAKMDHPNIVRIYDYLHENGLHTMVMEYVPGTDCATLVKKKGPLPFDLARHIMHETARALEEAHSHGFLHRDVKPSNILLHRKNRVLLSDFGLARKPMDTHLTLSHAVAGTPGFMSPEHVSGKELSFASDVYAWGVSFYYLLIGRLPYKTTELAALLNSIQEGRITLDDAVMEKVPGKDYALLHQCLVTDPQQRIPDGKELARKLDEAGENRRVDILPWISFAAEERKAAPAQPQHSTEVIRPGRGRFFKAGIAAAGLLVLAALAFFLLPRKVPLPPLPPAADTIAAPAPLPPPTDTGHIRPVEASKREKKEKVRNDTINSVVTDTVPVAAVPDSGGLFIFCSPWANIEIDGRYVGRTPLENAIVLPRGRHLIKLYNEFCEPLEEEVEVPADSILRRRYELKIKPAYQQ